LLFKDFATFDDFVGQIGLFEQFDGIDDVVL
jgi:hypothetical protein